MRGPKRHVRERKREGAKLWMDVLKEQRQRDRFHPHAEGACCFNDHSLGLVYLLRPKSHHPQALNQFLPLLLRPVLAHSVEDRPMVLDNEDVQVVRGR